MGLPPTHEIWGPNLLFWVQVDLPNGSHWSAVGFSLLDQTQLLPGTIAQLNFSKNQTPNNQT